VNENLLSIFAEMRLSASLQANGLEESNVRGFQTLRPLEGRDLTAIDTDSGVRSHGI
jgi:hypothetical protein